MNESRWLLLIHQIPPKPGYLRVKIGRRLQRLGAVAIKNSVYVLPAGDSAHEDFEWLLREIVEGGGDASICEARFVGGLSDAQIEALFQAARDADYAQIAAEAGQLARSDTSDVAVLEADLTRLRRRFAEIVAIDFFDAPGRIAAEGSLAGVEARLRAGEPKVATAPSAVHDAYRARTWVTRQRIFVDRMASAWLIRRWIDPEASIRFVPANGYAPRPGELRFDMFEAEFTHEADRCTFEVLIARFDLEDPALRSIAEIVHDIDLKDAKFARQDALGIERLLAGIAASHVDDEARLAHASGLLDNLYEYFRSQPE